MQSQSIPKHKGSKPRSVADRFWEKVDKNGPIPEHCPDLGPCWLWTGYCASAGYGQISGNPKLKLAHRVSWELHNGAITGGLWVLHRCDNPPCVNPDHLFLGTAKDNNDDMGNKGRSRGPRGANNPNVVLTEERVRELRARYEKGDISQRALADEYGVGHAAIRCALLGLTWAYVESEGGFPSRLTKRGESAPIAKLTENDVRAVRTRYAVGGVSQRALAREFGVCQATIRDVLAGTTWAHLD